MKRVFRYRNAPFTMEQHRPLEAYFKLHPASRTIVKKGRQVGMSESNNVSHWAMCIRQDYLHTMIAMPFQKQAQDFSDDKLDTLIDASPVLSDHMLNPRNGPVKNTKYRKRLCNNSLIRLVYVVTDPTRARGESMNVVTGDEFQEFHKELLPIIESTMDGPHKPKLTRYTGTPLTIGNILERRWRDSSQGEWVVPCHHKGCKKWNVPSASQHLLDMIGDEGVICAHCGRPINPQHPDAHWEHAYPDRRWHFEGLHVPQIIMPWWNEDKAQWFKLLQRQRDWPANQFYNEVLGESKDTGYKRLSWDDIRRACQLPRWSYREAIQQRNKYYDIVAMGADWGGKGAEEVSRTAYAVIGRRKDTRTYDLLCYKILPIATNPKVELSEMNRVYRDFSCDAFCYDYNVDPGMNQFMLECTPNVPDDDYWNIIYAGHTTRDLLYYTSSDDHTPSGFWTLDKTRSILTMFRAIQRTIVRLPPFDEFEKAAEDLMAFEEVQRTQNWQPLTRLRAAGGQPDDLADAINMPLMVLLAKHGDLQRVIQTKDDSLQSILDAVGGEPDSPYGPNFTPASEDH